MKNSVSVPTVTVCRDCCCGTERKHPGIEHDAQLKTLRDGLSVSGRVIVSQCLLVCDRSNVMVVSPSPAARGSGAKPVWLAGMLAPKYTEAVVDWVRAGGPGVAEMPRALRSRVEARHNDRSLANRSIQAMPSQDDQ